MKTITMFARTVTAATFLRVTDLQRGKRRRQLTQYQEPD